jgi:hypothetical protein
MGAMSPIPRDLSLYGHKHDRRKDGTHEMNGPHAYSTCFGAEERKKGQVFYTFNFVQLKRINFPMKID